MNAAGLVLTAALTVACAAPAQPDRSCFVYRDQGDIRPDTTFRWIGPCNADGLAEGEGYFLRDEQAGQRRSIVQLRLAQGRSSGPWTMYARFPSGSIYKMEFDGQTARPGPIAASDLPTWAVPYLTSGDVGGLGPATYQYAANVRPTALAEQELRELEEHRVAAERRRRDTEEDRRQMAQQDREDREARQRETIDAMHSALKGVAAYRQQQAAEQARLQAERQRIERDNERYRQQRAEQDRQWQFENQRRQQEATARQQAADQQERQRREQLAQAGSNQARGRGCIAMDRQGYPTGGYQAVGTYRLYYNSCTVCKENGEWTYAEPERCGIDTRSPQQPAPPPTRRTPGSGQR